MGGDVTDYYRRETGHEALDVIEAWGLGFSLGNVIKYVARAGRKPGVQTLDDLRKAASYLAREIARLERSDQASPWVKP